MPLDEAIRCVAVCPCARHQDSFVAALSAADELILRVMEPVGPGPKDAEESDGIQVATAVGPDGRSFLHAFADIEAAQATYPDGSFIGVAAQAAYRMSLANGNEGLLVTATGADDAWAAVTADGIAKLIVA